MAKPSKLLAMPPRSFCCIVSISTHAFGSVVGSSLLGASRQRFLNVRLGQAELPRDPRGSDASLKSRTTALSCPRVNEHLPILSVRVWGRLLVGVVGLPLRFSRNGRLGAGAGVSLPNQPGRRDLLDLQGRRPGLRGRRVSARQGCLRQRLRLCESRVRRADHAHHAVHRRQPLETVHCRGDRVAGRGEAHRPHR